MTNTSFHRRSRHQLHSALANRYSFHPCRLILPSLIDESEEGYDVVCFLGNVGQEEDWAAVEQKALKIGAKKMIIEDLRREFVTELCFPAIRKTAPAISWARIRK